MVSPPIAHSTPPTPSPVFDEVDRPSGLRPVFDVFNATATTAHQDGNSFAPVTDFQRNYSLVLSRRIRTFLYTHTHTIILSCKNCSQKCRTVLKNVEQYSSLCWACSERVLKEFWKSYKIILQPFSPYYTRWKHIFFTLFPKPNTQ